MTDSPAFEPRTITDLDGNTVNINVFNRPAAIAPRVRVALDQFVYLDGTGARELAQAVLDAADTLPVKDGWYTYATGGGRGRYAVRFYRGERMNSDGYECFPGRAPMTYIGPLTTEDIAQIEAQR